MNTLVLMALSALFTIASPDVQPQAPTPDSFTIDVDKVENGARIIEATPSKLVCSKKFTIKAHAKTKVIEEVVIVGGCPGNTKAICELLKGLTVDQAIDKLDGIQCGRRGTSCTDQIARVLKKAYGK